MNRMSLTKVAYMERLACLTGQFMCHYSNEIYSIPDAFKLARERAEFVIERFYKIKKESDPNENEISAAGDQSTG